MSENGRLLVVRFSFIAVKMKKLFEFREEYQKGALKESEMMPNPMAQFHQWLQTAIESDIAEPNAMTLATCSTTAIPSARVVLLKEITDNGFVFFTNYLSRKGRELVENPLAALVFDWHEIERQVRVEGKVQKLSDADSDAYFDERPHQAKMGAWTSPQSQVLKNREELDNLQTFYENKFNNNAIPRPPHWGGFILLPETIEFWQGRPSRLHDRMVYRKDQDDWHLQRLAP